MNTITVSGNAVRDAEPKATGAGLAVLKVRIAVNNRRKKNDEWVDEPVFIDVVTFGSQAEYLGPRIKKGDKMWVCGKISQSEWEKDGVKHSRIDILADRIELAKTSSDTDAPAAPTQAAPTAQQDFDSDVPF